MKKYLSVFGSLLHIFVCRCHSRMLAYYVQKTVPDRGCPVSVTAIPLEICGRKGALDQFVFRVRIAVNFHWTIVPYPFIYHPRDGQWTHSRMQLHTDTVSPRNHNNKKHMDTYYTAHSKAAGTYQPHNAQFSDLHWNNPSWRPLHSNATRKQRVSRLLSVITEQ